MFQRHASVPVVLIGVTKKNLLPRNSEVARQWWYTPAIPAFGRQRLSVNLRPVWEFQDSQEYTEKQSQRRKTRKRKK